MLRRSEDGKIDLRELSTIAVCFYLSGLAVFGLCLGLFYSNLLISGIIVGAGLGALALIMGFVAGIMALNRHG